MAGSSPPVRLTRLLAALPMVQEVIGGDVEISGIAADSRMVKSGNLFVAIPGVNVDGHRFIPEALRNGAVAVIGELPASDLAVPPATFTYARVPDAREAWGWLCAAWHDFPSRRMTIVGVTGTDGKTTTVNLIFHILLAAGLNAGMVSTVSAIIGGQELDTGLHTTTPDPPEIQSYLDMMVKSGATHAVLEVTSHGLAQHRVAGCDFDIAVVTNITHEHLDFHGSIEAYRQSKARLFRELSRSHRKPGVPKIAVLNRDDDSYVYLSRYPADLHISYAIHSADADVKACNISFAPTHTSFALCTPCGTIPVITTLAGTYNISNVLAAASVGVALGLSLEAIATGTAAMRGVPGRMERIDEGQEFLAIVDFAHTPNALKQALETVRMMTGEGGRVIVVFGSAGLRDRAKRALMGQVAGQLADIVIITAEDPRTESLEAIMAEIAAAAQAAGKREGINLWRVPDRGAALMLACSMAHRGDVVIACGKGHEQSMCFGTTEYPWDDREAMRRALHGRTLDTLPTAAASLSETR